MPRMIVMNGSGHDTLVWDEKASTDKHEREVFLHEAEEEFNRLVHGKVPHLAFEMETSTQAEGKPIKRFNPNAPCIVLVAPMAGGAG